MIGGNEYRYCREYNIALSNIWRTGTEVGRHLGAVPTITSHSSSTIRSRHKYQKRQEWSYKGSLLTALSTIRSRHKYQKRQEWSYEGLLLTALSTVYLSFLTCPLVCIPTCALDSRSCGRNLPCTKNQIKSLIIGV